MNNRGKNTIILNGRAIDAVTGQPIATPTSPHPSARLDLSTVHKATAREGVISDFGAAKPVKSSQQPSRQSTGSHGVHRKPERSKTLLRKAIKKPQPAVTTVKAPIPSQTPKTSVSRSPLINKFGKATSGPSLHTSKPAIEPSEPQIKTPATTQDCTEHRPQQYPHLTPPAGLKDSKSLKEHLIKEGLQKADARKVPEPTGVRKLFSKKPRTMHVVSMCLGLALLGGYLTYVNMPNLSVQVAAARSGVQASYPEYRPDGYHFAGPIAYSPGEVTLRFKSNTNTQGYTVKQRASNWDSQAVLDNFVTKDSESYLTYSEQGLTIYTYKDKAAWVNGGILYTIDGDAPLSSEQILRIAASM